MNTIFFVFLSTLILGVNCVVVQLKDGAINGTTTETKTGRLFYKFLGIPYAKPPIKKLRFQPPVPVDPWTGIKDVTQPPPKCVQWNFPSLSPTSDVGQEDCLYLNVLVPNGLLNSSRKAPVVVHIHGGAFQAGSAIDYAGDFMEKDIIFVSINYRLGLLGFLAINGLLLTPNNDLISGNFGLKDQALALQWVKENIEQFGGDSTNVTLWGGSAGAASIHFHMFSPFSKGLFQKAIMESGSAFSTWSRFPTRKYKINEIFDIRLDQLVAIRFLQETNCGSNYTQRLECLQDIPSEEFTKPGGGLQKYLVFLPIIEQDVTPSVAFLPNEPDASNYLTLVPWLAGMNSGEGAAIVPLLLRNGSYLAKMVNSYKEIFLPVTNLYIITANRSDMPNITQAVNNFYFGIENIGLETALHAVDMMTDSSWLYPLKTTVKSGPNQQYLYLYDYRGSVSGADGENITMDLGVAHGDEAAVILPDEETEAKRSIQDRRVSATMFNYWCNFMMSGDPNKHSKEKIWQPTTTKDDSFEYLHIKSDGVAMEKDLYSDRYNLWKSLPTGFY